MFEAVADREQVLAELRRRMAGVNPGSGQEKVGPALRPVLSPPTESVVGSGRAPVLISVAEPAPPPLLEPRARVGDRIFAVPAALAPVLPLGGLPRGGVVSLAGGSGTTSLLLSLLAAPEGTWSALVGLPALGLAAAAEFGVDLDRLVVVPDPGPDVLQVLSVLSDGVDLLVAGAPADGFRSPARLRVLTSRLRQHGSTLLVVGAWPGADLVLRTKVVGWTGIGVGHGRLRDRTLEVTVGGRGAADGRRSAQVLLSGDRSTVRMAVDPAAPDRRVSSIRPAVGG